MTPDELLRRAGMSNKTEHPQVYLPELGFTVDYGLEELIRACWRRGIATFTSCIGYQDEWGWIGFDSPTSAARWQQVVGWPVDWNDDDEVASVAETYFGPGDVPQLLNALRHVD